MTKRQQRQKSLSKNIQYLDKKINALEVLVNRYAWYRLGVFLGGLGISILIYFANAFIGWTLFFIALIVFNIIAFYHRKIDRSLKKHQIWKKIKSSQLARMKLDWDHIPQCDYRSGEADHPFEIDLDITGRHSLMQLLDITISREGQNLLGNWLLNRTPNLEDIQRRQSIVKELAMLPGFRDKLLLNFGMVSETQLEGKKFQERLAQEPDHAPVWVFPALVSLAIVNIILFSANLAGLLPDYWIYTVIGYVLIYFFNQGALKHIFSDVLFLETELDKIKAILTFLESYPYENNRHLAVLCHPFVNPDSRPSFHLKRIKRVMIAIGLRMNPAMAILLNLPLPYDFFVARQLEKAKAALLQKLPGWQHTWIELEALIALGNSAWLNPENSFPEIIASNKNEVPEKILEVQQMGHPLLPNEQKVCNNFLLKQLGEMVLITGSNMAGKSTFLKTIGINLLLAYAGGAVDAQYFKTALFRVFTSIKVADSVTDGFSYFYAEVRRLKALLNALKAENEYPLFFLIDEIFKGTNNRERYLGSKSYILGLAGKNGVGAISTHDLELTGLVDEIPLLKNYHFREEVANGKMVFDYRLRSGPCPTTNALIIMEMEGLPVNSQTS